MTIAQSLQYLRNGTLEDVGDVVEEVITAFEEVTLLTLDTETPLDDVLRLVGRRVCLFMGSSRCSVHLRRDDGLFQGRVGYAPGEDIDDSVRQIVSGTEEDLFTREIVDTREPVFVDDALGDPRTVQRSMRRWRIRSILGVPLVVQDEVIGIIYADDQDKARECSQREMLLAQAFATMAALAVRQGWMYEQLEERARTIEHQRRVLGQSSLVHSQVTHAVLEGASIDAILQQLADLLGKPVVLYGRQLEPNAWAAPESIGLGVSPALSVAEANLPWVQRALSRLQHNNSTVLLPATPELRCRRLISRVAAGGRCMGYLEVSELGRPFSAVDGKALEYAVMAVALKLLNEQREAVRMEQEREEFLSDLLYGRRDVAALTERARTFGLTPERDHLVLRVQYEADGATEELEDTGIERRKGVVGFIRSLLPKGVRYLAQTGLPGADLILVDLPPGGTIDAQQSLKELLVSEFSELVQRHAVRCVVISDACPTLSDLPLATEKIRGVAALLRQTRRVPQVVFARELALLRLITQREGLQEAVRFSDELLEPLVQHDATTSGGDLIATLQAYVESDCQCRVTAQEMGIHENTVRYRLKRIREVSGIDTDRFSSMLDIALALQVHALFRQGTMPLTPRAACDIRPTEPEPDLLGLQHSAS
jgi:sugar diacid utilization regulator